MDKKTRKQKIILLVEYKEEFEIKKSFKVNIKKNVLQDSSKRKKKKKKKVVLIAYKDLGILEPHDFKFARYLSQISSIAVKI